MAAGNQSHLTWPSLWACSPLENPNFLRQSKCAERAPSHSWGSLILYTCMREEVGLCSQPGNPEAVFVLFAFSSVRPSPICDKATQDDPQLRLKTATTQIWLHFPSTWTSHKHSLRAWRRGLTTTGLRRGCEEYLFTSFAYIPVLWGRSPDPTLTPRAQCWHHGADPKEKATRHNDRQGHRMLNTKCIQ